VSTRIIAVETNLFSLGITENQDRINTSHPEAHSALAMALTFRQHTSAFANISIYGQRLARQFERTLVLLRHIQAERRKTEERQLNKAAKILKMHNAQGLPEQVSPYNPAEDGFVFSNHEIETFSRRQDRAGQANVHDLHSHA
jgi:hypothetical protein